MYNFGSEKRISDPILISKLDEFVEEIKLYFNLSTFTSLENFINLTKGQVFSDIDSENILRVIKITDKDFCYKILLSEEFLQSDSISSKVIQKIVRDVFLEFNFAPTELLKYPDDKNIFASYIAYSLLMPKEKFFSLWYREQSSCPIKILNARFSFICSQLASVFKVDSHDVRMWQWMLKYQFLSYKNNILGNSPDVNLAKSFAQMVKKEVKSTSIKKIIEHFGGMLIPSEYYLKDSDFYPSNRSDYAFSIFVSYSPKIQGKEKKQAILKEFCDFFFEGEATLEEKEAFAAEFLPKSC